MKFFIQVVIFTKTLQFLIAKVQVILYQHFILLGTCFQILVTQCKSYRNALITLEQEMLSTRRLNHCKTFANKCLNHPRHSDLFQVNPRYSSHSRTKNKFLEPKCRTTRYYKSAIPFLTRILNSTEQTPLQGFSVITEVEEEQGFRN